MRSIRWPITSSRMAEWGVHVSAPRRRMITTVAPQRPEMIAAASPGHDAVLSPIVPHPRDALRPSTLLTDCARATVEAMTAVGVSRLAIVSAAVLFPEKGLYFAFFRWLLRHHARDLYAMEDLVRASCLGWTIARPPRLTNSPDVRFRALRDGLPPGSRAKIGRAHV